MICIYAIINIIDDKHYVGQASDRDYRWREHRKALRGFYHHSILLQRAWCKHGEHNFIFVVLEVLTDVSNLNDREVYWGNLLKPEYNVAPLGGSMRGYKHTDEARQNMSKSQIGKTQSEETIAKRRILMSGNQINKGRKQSEEVIAHRTKFVKGRKQSPEEIAKRVAARGNYRPTEETRAKMAAAKKGKSLSDEHKRKLSEAAKKQWERQLTNQKSLNTDNWKSSWPD
jgi:group I intron endonuclease